MIKKIMVILLILTLCIVTACTKQPTNEFPLTSDVIKQVIEDQQYDWEVVESQNISNKHIVVTLKNTDGVTLFVDSNGTNEARHLALMVAFPPDYTSEQLSEFNDKNIADLFTIIGALYCDGKELENTYDKYLSYLSNRNPVDYRYVYFTDRIKDTHILLRMSSRLQQGYLLSSIKIMNDVAYEQSLLATSKSMITTYERDKVVIKKASVSNISDETSRDKVLFITEGKIKDIQAIKDDDIRLNILSEYRSTKLHRDDYLSAKLVDDTGSIDVILVNRSLMKFELTKKRTHYIDYYGLDKLPVIKLSVEE